MNNQVNARATILAFIGLTLVIISVAVNNSLFNERIYVEGYGEVYCGRPYDWFSLWIGYFFSCAMDSPAEGLIVAGGLIFGVCLVAYAVHLLVRVDRRVKQSQEDREATASE